MSKKNNCLNKNKVIIQTKGGFVVIDRQKTPKYYIGEIEFNEYDMRALQLEVAKGNIPHDVATGLGIVDEMGVKFVFREDGGLVNNVHGYDITSRLVLDMLKLKPNKSC